MASHGEIKGTREAFLSVASPWYPDPSLTVSHKGIDHSVGSRSSVTTQLPSSSYGKVFIINEPESLFIITSHVTGIGVHS